MKKSSARDRSLRGVRFEGYDISGDDILTTYASEGCRSAEEIPTHSSWFCSAFAPAGLNGDWARERGHAARQASPGTPASDDRLAQPFSLRRDQYTTLGSFESATAHVDRPRVALPRTRLRVHGGRPSLEPAASSRVFEFRIRKIQQVSTEWMRSSRNPTSKRSTGATIEWDTI